MNSATIPIAGLGGKIVEQSFELTQAVSFEIDIILQQSSIRLVVPFNATGRDVHLELCSNYQYVDANSMSFTIEDRPDATLNPRSPLMLYPEFFTYYEQANAYLQQEGANINQSTNENSHEMPSPIRLVAQEVQYSLAAAHEHLNIATQYIFNPTHIGAFFYDHLQSLPGSSDEKLPQLKTYPIDPLLSRFNSQGLEAKRAKEREEKEKKQREEAEEDKVKVKPGSKKAAAVKKAAAAKKSKAALSQQKDEDLLTSAIDIAVNAAKKEEEEFPIVAHERLVDRPDTLIALDSILDANPLFTLYNENSPHAQLTPVISELNVSNCHPAPSSYRSLCGDLFYIDLWVGSQYSCITATPNGFYFNQSTRTSFKPLAKNNMNPCYTLLGLLASVVPSFFHSVESNILRVSKLSPARTAYAIMLTQSSQWFTASPNQTSSNAFPISINSFNISQPASSLCKHLLWERMITTATAMYPYSAFSSSSRRLDEEFLQALSLPRVTPQDRHIRATILNIILSDFHVISQRFVQWIVDTTPAPTSKTASSLQLASQYQGSCGLFAVYCDMDDGLSDSFLTYQHYLQNYEQNKTTFPMTLNITGELEKKRITQCLHTLSHIFQADIPFLHFLPHCQITYKGRTMMVVCYDPETLAGLRTNDPSSHPFKHIFGQNSEQNCLMTVKDFYPEGGKKESDMVAPIQHPSGLNRLQRQCFSQSLGQLAQSLYYRPLPVLRPSEQTEESEQANDDKLASSETDKNADGDEKTEQTASSDDKAVDTEAKDDDSNVLTKKDAKNEDEVSFLPSGLQIFTDAQQRCIVMPSFGTLPRDVTQLALGSISNINKNFTSQITQRLVTSQELDQLKKSKSSADKIDADASKDTDKKSKDVEEEESLFVFVEAQSTPAKDEKFISFLDGPYASYHHRPELIQLYIAYRMYQMLANMCKIRFPNLRLCANPQELAALSPAARQQYFTELQQFQQLRHSLVHDIQLQIQLPSDIGLFDSIFFKDATVAAFFAETTKLKENRDADAETDVESSLIEKSQDDTQDTTKETKKTTPSTDVRPLSQADIALADLEDISSFLHTVVIPAALHVVITKPMQYATSIEQLLSLVTSYGIESHYLGLLYRILNDLSSYITTLTQYAEDKKEEELPAMAHHYLEILSPSFAQAVFIDNILALTTDELSHHSISTRNITLYNLAKKDDMLLNNLYIIRHYVLPLLRVELIARVANHVYQTLTLWSPPARHVSGSTASHTPARLSPYADIFLGQTRHSINDLGGLVGFLNATLGSHAFGKFSAGNAPVAHLQAKYYVTIAQMAELENGMYSIAEAEGSELGDDDEDDEDDEDNDTADDEADGDAEDSKNTDDSKKKGKSVSSKKDTKKDTAIVTSLTSPNPTLASIIPSVHPILRRAWGVLSESISESQNLILAAAACIDRQGVLLPEVPTPPPSDDADAHVTWLEHNNPLLIYELMQMSCQQHYFIDFRYVLSGLSQSDFQTKSAQCVSLDMDLPFNSTVEQVHSYLTQHTAGHFVPNRISDIDRYFILKRLSSLMGLQLTLPSQHNESAPTTVPQDQFIARFLHLGETPTPLTQSCIASIGISECQVLTSYPTTLLAPQIEHSIAISQLSTAYKSVSINHIPLLTATEKFDQRTLSHVTATAETQFHLLSDIFVQLGTFAGFSPRPSLTVVSATSYPSVNDSVVTSYKTQLDIQSKQLVDATATTKSSDGKKTKTVVAPLAQYPFDSAYPSYPSPLSNITSFTPSSLPSFAHLMQTNVGIVPDSSIVAQCMSYLYQFIPRAVSQIESLSSQLRAIRLRHAFSRKDTDLDAPLDARTQLEVDELSTNLKSHISFTVTTVYRHYDGLDQILRKKLPQSAGSTTSRLQYCSNIDSVALLPLLNMIACAYIVASMPKHAMEPLRRALDIIAISEPNSLVNNNPSTQKHPLLSKPPKSLLAIPYFQTLINISLVYAMGGEFKQAQQLLSTIIEEIMYHLAYITQDGITFNETTITNKSVINNTDSLTLQNLIIDNSSHYAIPPQFIPLLRKLQFTAATILSDIFFVLEVQKHLVKIKSKDSSIKTDPRALYNLDLQQYPLENTQSYENDQLLKIGTMVFMSTNPLFTFDFSVESPESLSTFTEEEQQAIKTRCQHVRAQQKIELENTRQMFLRYTQMHKQFEAAKTIAQQLQTKITEYSQLLTSMQQRVKTASSQAWAQKLAQYREMVEKHEKQNDEKCQRDIAMLTKAHQEALEVEKDLVHCKEARSQLQLQHQQRHAEMIRIHNVFCSTYFNLVPYFQGCVSPHFVDQWQLLDADHLYTTTIAPTGTLLPTILDTEQIKHILWPILQPFTSATNDKRSTTFAQQLSTRNTLVDTIVAEQLQFARILSQCFILSKNAQIDQLSPSVEFPQSITYQFGKPLPEIPAPVSEYLIDYVNPLVAFQEVLPFAQQTNDVEFVLLEPALQHQRITQELHELDESFKEKEKMRKAALARKKATTSGSDKKKTSSLNAAFSAALAATKKTSSTTKKAAAAKSSTAKKAVKPTTDAGPVQATEPVTVPETTDAVDASDDPDIVEEAEATTAE